VHTSERKSETGGSAHTSEEAMGLKDQHAIIAVGVGLVLFWLIMIRPLWKGDKLRQGRMESMLDYVLFGKRVRRGVLRSAGIFFGWLLVNWVFVVLTTLDRADPEGSIATALRPLTRFMIDFLPYNQIIALFLTTLIVLFNWPKLLVPPHLRSDRGAFLEWFEKLRR